MARLCVRCGDGIGSLGPLREINFSTEYRIVFDSEAQRAHIAFYHASRAQFHAPTG